MGRSKACLEWHGSTLLRRIAGVAGRGCGGPAVVAVAPGQELPWLPAHVTVVRDPVEGCGPLQGIAGGLDAARQLDADGAVVVSVDLPLLHVAFVARLAALLREDPESDVVLPVLGGFRQPLAAAYRTSLAARAQALCADGPAKPGRLFSASRVREVAATTLLADRRLALLDPELESVTNVNDPDAYAAVRARPAPAVRVRCFGAVALGSSAQTGWAEVAAATVGVAAESVGVAMDGHVAAAIDGDHVSTDPSEPLCGGEEVAFISADAGG